LFIDMVSSKLFLAALVSVLSVLHLLDAAQASPPANKRTFFARCTELSHEQVAALSLPTTKWERNVPITGYGNDISNSGYQITGRQPFSSAVQILAAPASKDGKPMRNIFQVSYMSLAQRSFPSSRYFFLDSGDSCTIDDKGQAITADTYVAGALVYTLRG
jgi:hypothetical protein